MESHFLGLDEVNLWRTPDGASVLVMDPVPLAETLQRFFTPPTQNQLVQEQARVQVLNGSALDQADYLAAARTHSRKLRKVNPYFMCGYPIYLQLLHYLQPGSKNQNPANPCPMRLSGARVTRKCQTRATA